MEKFICDRCGADAAIKARTEQRYDTTVAASLPVDPNGQQPKDDFNLFLTLSGVTDLCNSCFASAILSILTNQLSIPTDSLTNTVTTISGQVIAEPPDHL